MKRKLVIFQFIFFWALVACSSNIEKMVLPADLELVNKQTKQDSVCFTCTHQIVVFHDFNKASFYVFKKQFLWNKFKDQFPDVGFIFYFSGQDRKKLINELDELEFPFPSYHDPEYRFYKLNQLDSIQTKYNVLHSFHLKDGIPIKRAQIGMGEYFLEEMKEVLERE